MKAQINIILIRSHAVGYNKIIHCVLPKIFSIVKHNKQEIIQN